MALSNVFILFQMPAKKMLKNGLVFLDLHILLFGNSEDNKMCRNINVPRSNYMNLQSDENFRFSLENIDSLSTAPYIPHHLGKHFLPQQYCYVQLNCNSLVNQ